MAEVKKQIPTIWTTGWTEENNTGTWRSAIPVYQKRPSPCHDACPVDGEIPVWVQLAKAEEYEKAWQVLMENNPFPAITGRICHHPCEGSCNRKEYDGAVAINALEQFIGDMAIEQGWELPRPTEVHNQKIAVVGGGPAGLSCAYQLSRRGYQVTVFETRSELGGILRYGIPEYRLAKEVVQQEIQRMLQLGIEISLGNAMKSTEDFAALEKEYDAVFLATGAHRGKRLPQFEVDNHRVLDCLDVLVRVNQGEKPELGAQVVVIGGGSSAMDVARTARRLGSKVTVVALETREIMPAQHEEVIEAMEEGILLYDGAMIKTSVNTTEGIQLSGVKVVLDQQVPPGVIKPIVIPGTDFKLLADTVILAVGLEPELYDLPELCQVEGTMLKVDDTFATDYPGFFAGGDVTSPYRFVSAAIGSGKKAANSISRYLDRDAQDVSEEAQKPSTNDIVSFQDVNVFYFPVSSRADKGLVEPELRLQDFREVKAGLNLEQVQSETDRCFSCGSCISCNNCYYFCPDQAIAQDSNLEEGYYIRDQYCKGCGLCVEECPRGAVQLKEEIR